MEEIKDNILADAIETAIELNKSLIIAQCLIFIEALAIISLIGFIVWKIH